MKSMLILNTFYAGCHQKHCHRCQGIPNVHWQSTPKFVNCRSISFYPANTFYQWIFEQLFRMHLAALWHFSHLSMLLNSPFKLQKKKDVSTQPIKDLHNPYISLNGHNTFTEDILMAVHLTTIETPTETYHRSKLLFISWELGVIS